MKALAALFPNDTSKINETSISYGESFKVDFVNVQNVSSIYTYFPKGKWLEFDTNSKLFNAGNNPDGAVE